jgi:hypothetical protein
MSDSTIARYKGLGIGPGRWAERKERKATRLARRERMAAIQEEVETAEDVVNGVYEVYESAMDGMAELDDHRKGLAGRDQALNMILGQMELDARKKIRRVVSGIFQ